MSHSGLDIDTPRQTDAEPTPRHRRRSVLTVVGVLLLAVGLSILGWIGYQFWGSNVVSHRQASATTRALQQLWASEPAGAKPVAPTALATIPGEAFALIRIPRLGSSWQYPVFAGTTDAVLARGVGWYDTTAKPGVIGNFAVAAHRVTHGEPFRHLLDLRAGDQVIVETRDHVYTYVIDAPASALTVQDTESWVLDPVPGHPAARPTTALITLTTCAELFHAPTRSVAFGHLTASVNK